MDACEVLFIVLLTILAAYYSYKSSRTIYQRLKQAKAFSPETAVKPEEAKIPWWCELHLELVAEKTKDGRYYLKKKNDERKSY